MTDCSVKSYVNSQLVTKRLEHASLISISLLLVHLSGIVRCLFGFLSCFLPREPVEPSLVPLRFRIFPVILPAAENSKRPLGRRQFNEVVNKSFVRQRWLFLSV